MKKNECIFREWKIPGLQKVLRIMKLTVFLLLLSVISVFAGKSYSQTQVLNLNLKNSTVKEVLRGIEKQSEFVFMYSEKLIDVNREVSVTAKNKKINAVLDELFAGTNVEYKVKDRFILLTTPEVTGSDLIIQQQPAVSGTVTAESGEPLPGVTVVVKGTTQGTVTNTDGEYTLAEIPEDATLVFSFVGMQTQEVEVGDQTSIDVTMEEETVGIEEVVAIGYGTRQQRDLTGAVSNIGSEDIEKSIPSMTPELAMQGNMPGVFVSNPGSDPTARPEIRIRGVSTLGYNDPLYVIDGVPITEGGASGTDSRTADVRGPVNVFSTINPNDIESISVLKDASATAIYGVRASNGVILITTKRGESGKMKINVSAKYGVQNLNKRYDVTNVQQYVMLSREAWKNNTANVTDNFFPLFDETSSEYLGNSPQYTEDWEDAAMNKNAVIQDYNLSISGGNEISNYALGGNYVYHEDVLFKSNVERYSFFINSDHKMTKWLKVGETLRLAYNQTDKNAGGSLNKSFVVPWQPLYDEKGLDGYALPGREIEGNFHSYGYGNGTIDNDFGSAIYEVRQRDLLRSLGSLYAEVSPLDGLRIKGTYSFDYYTNTQQSYNGMDRGYFEANRGAPYEDEGNGYRRRLNENINLIAEFLISYNQNFGNHNFDLILNAMDQRIKWNTSQAQLTENSNIPSWEQRRIDDGLAPEATTYFYERTPSGLQGYMSRLSYNYGRKYYLDATVRRDGTSKFGPGYKWGTFPSFALAWRISDEPFMNGISWLTDLKFRGGWGQTGNQETREFAYLSSVDLTPLTAFGSDPGAFSEGYGNLYSGATLKDFPIADMSWETVTSTNFGFDSRLFNGKIDVMAEYYYRLTDGILQSIQIPLLIGAINQPVVNLAQIENSGFEFSGIFRENLGNFGFNASFNLTTVKNNVLKLYEDRPYGGNQNR
ncbi:MAG: SusC/RagA family TonB-linked outer membrane protein, partial [Bacteroidota bacterium]